ncbi:MAG: prepilin-type N-terminal cleavage/methylation domain-containing protein [Erysipelotrichaceae bacterium]|nr:prepilin-type N-terminal cleavage/methylation domain-containing protein [Erysipelotrichaceae bacterium]
MKKGFTLVELLAVIAILAILIIIALPNVLEMFNNAKKDVFVTEVKTVTSSAEKRFLTSQISGDVETTFCRSETDSINPLNMSGAEKYYYIELNSKGRIRYLVVWDDGKYIKYKYSSSKSVTSIDKKDIVENDNESITCANVIDELNVATPTPIEDMELVAVMNGTFNDDEISLNIRLLDSETLSGSIVYRIYQLDYDYTTYNLIAEVTRENNDDEFFYKHTKSNNICYHSYRIDAYYNEEKIKEATARSNWGC